MLWCLGSADFLSEVESFSPLHQQTRDPRRAAAGDRLLVEIGADLDAQDIADATRRGVTVMVCAQDQVSLLLASEAITSDDPSAADDVDSVDLEAWRQEHAAEIIGRSAGLREALEMAERVSRFDCPVLITGESGTGKELIARAIHRASERRERAFVAVNCPAIPKDLVESELFGHAKGAFTGAVSAREGRFVAADGGTLFLDEIGEMDLEVQRKLLRVLQDFSVTPVGESRARTVDVRIVAATNQDLDAMSEKGEFRLDLLYRLNVVQIHLPPLRERTEDVGELFDHHLGEAASRLGAPAPVVDDEIRATLLRAPWPGNIRQLRNVAERLVVLRAGRAVRLQDLPATLRRGADVTPIAAARPVTPANAQVERAAVASASRSGDLTEVELPKDGVDLRATLQRLEARLIRQAILATSGNRNQAARLLGLNRTTLVEKLRKQPQLAVA